MSQPPVPGTDLTRERIQGLVQSAGQERALYLGEAIGNVLAIAWNAFAALGSRLSSSGSSAAATATGNRRSPA
jgi:hypothetical protein